MSEAMQMLKCCLNPKVLIGLGAVAIGVLLVAPDLISRAFPLLLVLVCPLSMLVMMLSMSRMGGQQIGTASSSGSAEPTTSSADVSNPARVAELRAQLDTLAKQQSALASEIEALELADRLSDATTPQAGTRTAVLAEASNGRTIPSRG